MADRAPSLQDLFLNQCRRGHVPVTIFLVKGVKLGGIITWFDNFSLLLKRDGQAQLVYKHAISTIIPAAPLDLGAAGDPAGRGALQDLFLAAAERQQGLLKLFLVNGVMLAGRADGHDQFVLVLSRDGQQQLVYKHAVSTIQPETPLDLMTRDGDADEQAPGDAG